MKINWSDHVVPGPGSRVTIPEILPGNYYPSDFNGMNPDIERLDIENGASLIIPGGIIVTVGSGR